MAVRDVHTPSVDVHDERLTLDDAIAVSTESALRESVVGEVGIELETHLVDLHSPAERVSWDDTQAAFAELSAAARHCSVTFEPGGQVELSGPPCDGVATAVQHVREDMQRVRVALAGRGLGLAHVGADPLRPTQRTNPRARYSAMEQHFAATGRAACGAQMMTSTAAMQVNLQAGPRSQWADRVAHAHALGPTLVAMSACSPWLGGRDTGLASARQQVWHDLNAPVRQPLTGASDPGAEWAAYAMRSPVAFVTSPGGSEAVRGWVPFEAWASGRVLLDGRCPTRADLDLHLTTLFPPVRLRGYLELRYLDTTPPRWWPAIAAVVATLMDEPDAADASRDACAGTEQLWVQAATLGLAHPPLAASARRCAAIAAEHAPPALRGAVDDLAEALHSGQPPGAAWKARIAQVGPAKALEEASHA